MLQMRYRTAILLALFLLAVGGLSVYLFERSRSPGNATPAPTERTDRNATPPPDKPVQDMPPVGDEDLAKMLAEKNLRRLLRRDKSPVVVGGHRRRSRRLRGGGGTAGHSPPGADICRHARSPIAAQQIEHRSPVGCTSDLKPGTDYNAARQEVINRLQFIQQLPVAVLPQLCPQAGRRRDFCRLPPGLVPATAMVGQSTPRTTSRHCRTGIWNVSSAVCLPCSTSSVAAARSSASRSSPTRTASAATGLLSSNWRRPSPGATPISAAITSSRDRLHSTSAASAFSAAGRIPCPKRC